MSATTSPNTGLRQGNPDIDKRIADGDFGDPYKASKLDGL